MKKHTEDEFFQFKDKLVYIFVGSDPFIIEKAINSLKEKIKSKFETFEIYSYNTESIELTKIIDNCNSLSLFSRKQFITVRGVEKLKKDDLEFFETYIKNPNPETILLLLAEKIDMRLKVWQQMKEYAGFYDFAIKNDDIDYWIDKIAKDYSLILSPEIKKELFLYCGENLSLVNEILEKYSFFSKDNKLTIQDLSNFLPSDEIHTVFELTDALGKKDVSNAIKLLKFSVKEKSSDKGPYIQLLALLARQIRLLLQVKAYKKLRLSNDEISKKLGIHYFVVKKIMEQEKNFVESQLSQALIKISQADYLLKSSRMDSKLIMENIIWDICK